jgi:tRNA-splicing ligase RtcB (3'-phosphate/5'-hydroxy nucleic acid ligase)
MFDLKKLDDGIYLLPKTDDMKVPGLVIATKDLLSSQDINNPLKQIINVAALPGIVSYSIAMPDIHWGYGFPIGGVAAMDIDEGVITPGGVGYDINCGVRMAVLPIKFDDIKDKNKLLQSIYEKIPSGVGSEHKTMRGLSEKDYKEVVTQGARWAVEQGWGIDKDIDHIENFGKIDMADISCVSSNAKKRGEKQLGSLGSGNHFIEIGKITKIFEKDIASQWNVFEGMTYVLIHSGSRGFGHQICQDYLDKFIKLEYANHLVDKQLVYAPISSNDGKSYFAAMASAANFAFNNRQIILHKLREVFSSFFNISHDDMPLVYDVCHNIAKFETHLIGGKEKSLCVHRKGATRALGVNDKDLTLKFQKTGQPVLVPGDMGRCSYLLAGMGNATTWKSCCHGAGRARSRIQSLKAWKGKDTFAHMKGLDISVLAKSKRTIAEEMPDAYKDVDSVIEAVILAKLARNIALLKPKLVVKG